MTCPPIFAGAANAAQVVHLKNLKEALEKGGKALFIFFYTDLVLLKHICHERFAR
jgi:hypothetical protein